MKGIFFLVVFGIGLIGLSGCYTVPHHYTYQEVIVYYPAPPPSYPPDPEPWPIPDPPYPPPTNPPKPRPDQDQPVDRQPEKPQDSYDQRDQLQGGSHRDIGGIKTDPPVRNPVAKDRGRQ